MNDYDKETITQIIDLLEHDASDKAALNKDVEVIVKLGKERQLIDALVRMFMFYHSETERLEKWLQMAEDELLRSQEGH